jgi:MFS family permease
MWSKNFVFLSLSNFLMYVIYYAIISVLPVYLVCELKAGSAQVGAVMATYTIASVLIRPFSGFALDKFGRRSVFLLALLFYSFFYIGYLLTFTIAALTILRFLHGLTWGFTTISGSTIAVDIIPSDQRGEGIGYFALSTTLGMSVGPIVGAFVCHHWGYTALFISGIVISVTSLLFAYNVKLPKRLIVGRNISFEWGNLFDRKSILPSLNVLIIMSTYGGLLAFIALYGREIGIHNTSSFFLIFAFGIAISRIITGKIFDKNGPGKIITSCILLLLLGFPFLALVKNEVGFYVSAIVIGFGIGVVFPVFSAIVNNLAEAGRRGAANSTLYTALDLGMGLGMTMAGFVAQRFSISAVFITNAFICLIGLVFFRVLVLKKE